MLGNKNKDYFISKIEPSEKGYILDYECNNCKMQYDAEEKADLISFARKYMKNKKNMIILNKK